VRLGSAFPETTTNSVPVLVSASGTMRLGRVGSGYFCDFEGASWGEAEKPVSSDAVVGEQFGSALVMLVTLARRIPVDIDRR
jgi:hypothetical protein